MHVFRKTEYYIRESEKAMKVGIDKSLKLLYSSLILALEK